MEHEFWHDRWNANQIGFHEGEANAHLVAHFDALCLLDDSRVFVPLCGKTRDIAWLLSKGHRIAGAELSQIAVQQLFAELEITPEISELENLKLYQSDRVTIFVGDIFALNAAQLGTVDAVFDRAALVALPAPMRDRYAAHLTTITAATPQLLVTFEYDQSVMAGPPFSLIEAEVRRHYSDNFDLTALSRTDVKDGLKGICPATETVWLLSPK